MAIAGQVGCTEPTVVKWRRQYAEDGLAGLEDAKRPGGPRRVLTERAISEILSATVAPPSDALRAAGVTHWSSRRLAEWLRRSRKIEVSHDSINPAVAPVLPTAAPVGGVQVLHRPGAGRQGPRYRRPLPAPQDNAVVVCVDETQCQALERNQPVLPMRSGIPERQAHDYARHGVTCLFAALEVATGTVTDAWSS